MNLSRAGKKFRNQTQDEPKAPKPAKARKEVQVPPPPVPAPLPAAAATSPAEPVPDPVAGVPAGAGESPPAARPKKGGPEKAKRPRFVREKVEPRVRGETPALPSRSRKPAARLMTRNILPPPKEEGPKSGR